MINVCLSQRIEGIDAMRAPIEHRRKIKRLRKTEEAALARSRYEACRSYQAHQALLRAASEFKETAAWSKEGEARGKGSRIGRGSDARTWRAQASAAASDAFNGTAMPGRGREWPT